MFAGNQGRPLGYAQVVIEDGQVQGLPGLDPDGLINGYAPVFTIVRTRFGGISWRDDGEKPTPDKGMPLMPSDCLRYSGDPSNIKFCPQDEVAGFVVVHVLYYAAAPNDDEV